MKINNHIGLPSNHKFGYFFTFIFLIASMYFLFKEINMAFFVLGTCSIVFFLVTLFKAEILRPLNKLWMGFGLVLGMIVSPIVMGAIFFIIFTPIGILMRFFGRDELLLQFKTKPSYWTKRNEDIHSNSFRSQF
jgi:hypothetical protein